MLVKKQLRSVCWRNSSVPVNVDKPSAVNIYIKELVKETVSWNRTQRVDEFLTNIQEAICNVLGPVTQLWVSAAKQELLAVEGWIW